MTVLRIPRPKYSDGVDAEALRPVRKTAHLAHEGDPVQWAKVGAQEVDHETIPMSEMMLVIARKDTHRQDLDGDGIIGTTPMLIETQGSKVRGRSHPRS